METEKLLYGFKGFLENEKMSSESTVSSYMADIRQYMEWCKKPLNEVNKTDILSYKMAIESRGVSVATVSRKIASIRCFYQFLMNSGAVDKDPTINIKSPKQERKTPETLTISEVERLLCAPDTNSIKGIRDRAILEIMYGSGLKVSEIVELKLDDINLELEYVKCSESSDGERYVPISKKAKAELQEYLKYGRHVLEKSDSETLFLNMRGDKLTRQGLWKMIKDYAKVANIDKNINPLTMRHSFAVHMIENGADIKSIQDLLGHVDISTTQIYQLKCDQKLKEVYRKTHPRSK
ncbi:tyrosine recombinase XerD [Andreesenia angusta]|uniref:Tyrosine recombinase XerD n=1 Tax=Andreesenia angusta TaxID=39480 RepID=A0A1S1V8Z2_9FIRM|nr:site-specific tyrosine recombinase/integron integrase [Andreesenia angusta]OHW62974.1 tyrosine recombinase XerD [Andreesenia angusta]